MTTNPLFPTLPQKWETASLGEVCQRGGGDIQTGPFGSQLHASDYVPVGVPSIMPVNIGENRINPDGIARIRPEDAERLSRYRVRAGDVVYSRRGDVERRALVTPAEDGWLCGTGCLRVRLGAGPVDPVFASYYLGDPSVRAWIVRHAVGATMPNLNTSILSALPFLIPPLAEQRAIAAILGALDAKIELNGRMNETLEAMARALFKSWFVDFDPVRAKAEGRQPAGMDAETAALFPDEFEEIVTGQIPSGWSAGTLGEVATSRREGVLPDEVDPLTPYIGLEHMPRGSIALGEWGSASEISSNKSCFSRGDILFGKLRPYFRKVGIAIIDGVCSTDILVIAPKTPEWLGFVLCHVSSGELIDAVNAASTGTKMPRASWHDIARHALVLPPSSLARTYNDQVQPMIAKIAANLLQGRILATIRDALLPKLMSGEINVDVQVFRAASATAREQAPFS